MPMDIVTIPWINFQTSPYSRRWICLLRWYCFPLDTVFPMD